MLQSSATRNRKPSSGAHVVRALPRDAPSKVRSCSATLRFGSKGPDRSKAPIGPGSSPTCGSRRFAERPGKHFKTLRYFVAGSGVPPARQGLIARIRRPVRTPRPMLSADAICKSILEPHDSAADQPRDPDRCRSTDDRSNPSRPNQHPLNLTKLYSAGQMPDSGAWEEGITCAQDAVHPCKLA
jgi:hypothetical protein